jgi:hypothetical protein
MVISECRIADSWGIARRLDEEYPKAPTLFGSGAGGCPVPQPLGKYGADTRLVRTDRSRRV